MSEIHTAKWEIVTRKGTARGLNVQAEGCVMRAPGEAPMTSTTQPAPSGRVTPLIEWDREMSPVTEVERPSAPSAGEGVTREPSRIPNLSWVRLTGRRRRDEAGRCAAGREAGCGDGGGWALRRPRHWDASVPTVELSRRTEGQRQGLFLPPLRNGCGPAQ